MFSSFAFGSVIALRLPEKNVSGEAIGCVGHHLESRSSSSALALGFDRLGLSAAVFSARCCFISACAACIHVKSYAIRNSVRCDLKMRRRLESTPGIHLREAACIFAAETCAAAAHPQT
jgi:hypothetical protein